MLLRSFSIASLSPKPLMVILAPCPAKARAMARPMPEVEPVTSADFPFSMITPNSMMILDGANGAPREDPWEDAGGRENLQKPARTVRRFLLRRNIKIGRAVTFSRSPTDALHSNRFELLGRYVWAI